MTIASPRKKTETKPVVAQSGLNAILSMPMSHVLMTSKENEEEKSILRKLRPTSWEQFIGHEKEVMLVRRLIKAAQDRGEQPDHILFYGPPGTGKTALAELAMTEFNGTVNVSVSETRNEIQMYAKLIRVDIQTAVFVDEIHNLNSQASDTLIQSMENTGIFRKHPQYTLIGATTKKGMLDQPLVDRFGLSVLVDHYKSCQEHGKPHQKHGKDCQDAHLNKIVSLAGEKLEMDVEASSAAEVAQRSRGTPRIAGRLLRRVRDVSDNPTPTQVAEVLMELGVDQFGLEDVDRKYILLMATRWGGGPVGLRTLATVLGDSEESVAEGIEPYLLRLGLIENTSRGRRLSAAGIRYATGVGKALGISI